MIVAKVVKFRTSRKKLVYETFFDYQRLLESLWNSTSSDTQQIFLWPSENNTAREELKKKFKIFTNSLPQLQLLAWPRENFFKI